MTSRWEAWFRLLPVWLPALVLSIASVAFYWWQSSDSTGTGARLNAQVSSLEEGIGHLQELREQALAQQEQVSELSSELNSLSTQSFGSLEGRLITIMREVEAATRQAGMLPDKFGYSTNLDDQLPFTRFGITFYVEGQYSQVRQMLATLQQSPELLIVEKLTLVGEKEATSRKLTVSLSVATYLGKTDEALVDRLAKDILAAVAKGPKEQEETEAPLPAAQATTAEDTVLDEIMGGAGGRDGS